MQREMFYVHLIVQSSQQHCEVHAVLTATVQVRGWDITRSGVLPRVLWTVEKLGCEPTLDCLEAVLLSIILYCQASPEADINLESLDA